ncbi:hypothetical protein [Deinococcus cellulosilyticus]|uniref:Uncharacterized protein n=1 Tax=Deinococcus cellulosilyticus (strain DSM 18568 / NBRC 106333 / KACC 11606 / 5516J-15) TaxID=1223518 RepID=A0A511MY81_DEIC1|nr:hypothetical protein [Deinococcus cellulosilyticus]GEM45311.1 hypothetical protein DC3_09460 [Deinococcus cellulosilyticus NBRC 106333 = KACC 11606]
MGAPRGKTISSQSESSIVTLTSNVANVRTPIFEVLVPRGVVYLLANQNRVRDSLLRGMLMLADLNVTAGTRISGATTLSIAVQGPSDESEKIVRTVPYSPWRDLPIVNQRNDDYKTNIISALDLGEDTGFKLPEAYKLMILAKGPDVIDWTKSYLEIPLFEVN